MRRSINSCPSETRATTGGSPRRSRLSNPVASSSNASAMDGIRAVGNAPPPTLASLFTARAVEPTVANDSVAARARSPRLSMDAPSIASTGISRMACAGSRYKASVASSAARVSLSTRYDRASGFRRSSAMAARSPTMIPACGPPSSLSPLIITSVAPARNASRAVGSPVRPMASSGSNRPLPRS